MIPVIDFCHKRHKIYLLQYTKQGGICLESQLEIKLVEVMGLLKSDRSRKARKLKLRIEKMTSHKLRRREQHQLDQMLTRVSKHYAA